jgi:hypothetical protein
MVGRGTCSTTVSTNYKFHINVNGIQFICDLCLLVITVRIFNDFENMNINI